MSEVNATETALIKVNPSGDEAVIQLRGEAVRLQRFAENRVIQSEDDNKLATEDLNCLSKLKKAITEKRKEYTDPIATHLAEVTVIFKTIMEPLEAADKITRDKMLGYRAEVQKKREEADAINKLRMEAAQREAALNGTGEISESVNLVHVEAAPPKTVNTDTGSASTVKTWHSRVVDFKALPDEYKMANTVLLNAMAKGISKTGIPVIAGVEFYQEESIRISPR